MMVINRNSTPCITDICVNLTSYKAKVTMKSLSMNSYYRQHLKRSMDNIAYSSVDIDLDYISERHYIDTMADYSISDNVYRMGRLITNREDFINIMFNRFGRKETKRKFTLDKRINSSNSAFQFTLNNMTPTYRVSSLSEMNAIYGASGIPIYDSPSPAAITSIKHLLFK